MSKILFITHDSSRTGAPFVLLYFLQWLKKQKVGIEITVLDLKAGELSEDFRQVSHDYINLASKSLKNKVFSSGFFRRYRTGRNKSARDLWLQELSKRNFDLIYANTIISLPYGLKIKNDSFNSVLLLHVHELSTIISLLLPRMIELNTGVDNFIAASKLVKETLTFKYAVEPKKIQVIHDFSTKNERFGKNMKKKGEKLIIGGAGTVHWRKGSDLFIQVALWIRKKAPEIEVEFHWIGGATQEEKIILEADIHKMELSTVIHFFGDQEDPRKFFRKFDVFLLPSREDPFPLVAIETGMLGKPIICFEKATGLAEFLHNGGGFVVPYLDTEAMAEKIIFYHKNRKNLEEDGNAARKIFSEFTSEKKCPEIFSLIQQLVNE